jgi:ABC-2 type transport system permease protein
MLAWKGFFYSKANADGMAIRGSVENLTAIFKSLGVLLIYIFCFVSSAIFIFNRKDILT